MSMPMLGTDPVVVKSLRITRTTFYVVAAFTAAVAANVMVTLQTLSFVGQAAVLMLTFVFVCIITAALAVDIFLRSSQSLATLRTLGAKRGAVSATLMVSLLAFGASGSAIGVVLGAGLGAALSAFGSVAVQGIAATLVDGLLVWGLSIAAIGVGVFIGVRTSWRS